MSDFPSFYGLDLINVFLLLGVLLIAILWQWKRTHSDLPPGPRGFPGLGVINLNPDNLVESMRQFHKTYGDVCGFYIGSTYIVNFFGYERVKEVLITHGDVFSDRPSSSFFFKLANFEGIIANSGESWKEQRTFSLSTLREFGFGKKNLETRIMEEVSVFVDTIQDMKGEPFDVKDQINISISNVICSIVFGRRFEYSDPKFIELMKLLDDNFTNSGPVGILQFFPFLIHLPGDLFHAKRFIRNSLKLDSYYQDMVDEHKRKWDENNLEDFIDVYLKEIKRLQKGENYTTINEKQLIRVLNDLFGAGTTPSAALIRWGVLFLLNFPDEQVKVRKELDAVVGHARFPSLSDRPNLPQTNAFITEVMRLGNVVPLGVPHAPTKDTYINGYRIPKESFVLPNLDSVVMDPNLFPNPTKFNPQRFINEEGKLCNHEKVLNFSLGRRSCLGESLAKMEIFLFLTSLIQRFQLLPVGSSPPSLEGMNGISFAPKDFKFRANPIQ